MKCPICDIDFLTVPYLHVHALKECVVGYHSNGTTTIYYDWPNDSGIISAGKKMIIPRLMKIDDEKFRELTLLA